MKQIFPDEGEVDPISVYNNDARQPLKSRPWVLLNMVNSIDGFISFIGGSEMLKNIKNSYLN